MNQGISDNHRLFYVNGKLEFAFFYDQNIKDKNIIIDTFLNSKDWKFYCYTYDHPKVKEVTISDDLKTVNIVTK